MSLRKTLSHLLSLQAERDKKFIVLSGDHGYAFFDELRATCPGQFINCGIMEQAMVGIAAGLSKMGYRIVVYGLASFIPLRVLEQIKLDICHPKLPVIFIGDGAGLVYSKLGASHHSGEDIAALRPIPNIQILSPSTTHEMSDCFQDAMESNGPVYLRIGKEDLKVEQSQTSPRAILQGLCMVATGSMVSKASQISQKLKIPYISISHIKPLDIRYLRHYRKLIVIEEHSRYGGLTSALMDAFCERQVPMPKIIAFTLKDQFANECGDYEFALSEHGLTEKQLLDQIETYTNE